MTASFKTMILGAAVAALVAMPMVSGAQAKPGKRWDHGVVSTKSVNPANRYVERRMARVATPVINQRLNRQANRIQAGRRSGDLTRFEAMRLKGRLFAIHSALRFARLDGQVTPRERRHIQRMLDQNSERIGRLRHNRRGI